MYYTNYLHEALRFGDEMTDFSSHFPEDTEVSGLPKSEAVQKARAMLAELGVRLLPGERVYTIDQASYAAAFQKELAESEFQADISKRYLEPLDPNHEGYFMVFEQELA